MKTEMNMHVPQSVEAAIELREIASVAKQMISPRLSKPLVSVVQDTLVGVNRLTRPTEFFTRREFMNLLIHSKRWDGVIPPPAKRDPVPLWSGRQVVSALLPAVFLKAGNKKWKDAMGRGDQNYVVINGGKIEQGILDGDTFDKGLIHILYNDFSPEATVDFIDGLQAVVATYLQNSGFSVGLSDIVADTETLSTISTDMETLKKRIEALQLQVHMGLFDNTSGRSNQEEFEGKVFQTLDKMVELAGQTGLASLPSNNRMVNMIACGSKGSNVNIAQMIATLGQQSIEGKRIGYGFQDRTLPHFKRYDDGAEARGFIESSFVKGLSPSEFYFHAMTGREGLIDTAVKSVTGETPIIVLENGCTRRVPIGDWIDAQLAESETEVEHFEERQMELLQLKAPVYIPTTDADGVVSWGEITAITRHDPGKELYEIKTLAGKSVIVTESKSLLIYNDEKKQFERMSTPDVRPGHYVPTTMQLPTPPHIISEVSMSSYLPKETYLYGSEFIKARAAIDSAMAGRERIPCGWWEEHNGKTFTLPYSDKAKLQRVVVRSDISNIREGFVYPFTSNREHSAIPDVFTLNHENGIFLGLFLAEGNVDIKSGYVQITNNNKNIQCFVTSWFEKMGMKSGRHERINHIGGTTSDVRGYSTVLAQFLTSFVGHGSANKRVPSELFAAPEDFIAGLLSGYFSGDGTITENSIEAGSASALLMEGISMLCTRLGIFGKIFITQLKSNNIGTEIIAATHRIAIRAQWAARFAEKITMIDDSKEKKLRDLHTSESHRNFPYQNDVILDCITEINIIGVEKYPKVYDLTVPSTLNFGLANGLHVVDTADSGYMQRQLVKAMEDLMVFHDGSVRDAGGLVVQFSYGDDGTSATKIENQPIALGEMSDSEINGKFAVADAAPEASQAHLAAVFEDRDMLVRNVWGGRVDKTVQSAVHLPRLIANAVQQLGLRSDSAEGKELVNGGHVLETIQRIIQQTNSKNRLWAALLRYHLNPRGLQGLGFTRAAFDWLAEQIVVKHMKSWVVPGEMSGIIAAQSLGEPTTQMCNVFSTVVTIGKISGPASSVTSYFTGKVGSFVDKLMSENAAAVRLTGHGPDNKVLDLPPEYMIMGVSNDEKTSWKPISQVSRHPANGGLVTVTTKSGRKTTATLTHSFLKRTTTGIAEVKGSDLEIGQRIPVACRIPESPIGLSTFKGFALTKEFGWLVGIYLADGSLCGNSVKITKIHPIVEERIRTLAPTYGWTVTTRHYKGAYGPSKETVINNKQLKDVLLELGGKGSYDKFISSHIFHAKRDFIAGVLSGYFDGDGNVNVTRQQIRVGSRSETLIRDIARLLGYCGVFAAIKQETSIRIPGAVMYTANIIRKHAAQFEKIIGLTLPEKAAALTQIVTYNDRADFHSQKEELDMIPELGEVIAETGRLLKMPGASRTYGRWVSKAAIGRRTLERYIGDFLDMMKVHVDPAVEMQVKRNIAILESARQADVIWDEIVALDYQEDPHELVYDFTVPGNDSFMVDDNIFVHNTLNTFHLSGVAAKSGMTRGVPRLKELLKVTPNIRASSLTIYLRPDLRSSKEAARKLAQELEFTMLKDLVTVSRIYFDPRDAETLIAEDKEWLSFFADFEQSEEKAGVTKSPWIMRLELNREKMFNKNITMEDVHFMIRKYNGETDVTYTDHNAGRLIFRIRPTASGKDLDDLAAIKQMQTKLLTSVLVRGLPGLKAVTFRKVTDESFTKNPEKDNKYEATEQYVLDTLGSNFLDVMIHPNVDGLKLLSNHVHDIYENLGIEAARQVLFKEIFTLFEQAAPVNCRHVALLCDAICNRGRMMPADRNGVNKKKSGPLAKASFEQTGEIMLKAAIFGEMDPVTGVAANIMTGQPIRGGTSFTPMLLDEAAMLEFIASAPPPKRTIERAPTLVQQEIDRLLEADDTAPGCRQQDLRIPAALPSGPVDSTPMDLPDMEIVLVDD
jgi:DNA-directed RNA polymerase beta' subunit